MGPLETLHMQTLDRLRIRDLRVRAHVGVTAAERDKLQDVVITVTLHADLSRAARSDRLDRKSVV